MTHELAISLNVGIVCATLLTALYMLRRSVERVSRQKHTVFMLLLPFGITWMFAGGENSSEIEEVVKVALLQRSRRADGPRQPQTAPPPKLDGRRPRTSEITQPNHSSDQSQQG